MPGREEAPEEAVRQRLERKERELEETRESRDELSAQGAAVVNAIQEAEAALTHLDDEELAKLGLNVPDEVSEAGRVLTETLEVFKAIEPGINQERQRFRDYADGLRAKARQERSKKAPDFAWAEQLESEAASIGQALDTIDPSGEEECETCEGSGEVSTEGQVWQDGQCTDCDGTGKKPAASPSGEQEEEKRYTTEQARMRLRETLAISEPPQDGTDLEYFIRAAFPNDPSKEEQSGVELIVAERERQVREEGWTPEHDDKHVGGQLAKAAACYAVQASGGTITKYDWPWEGKWWKPGDPIRGLTKAGALIAAEIDRLLRASSEEVQGDG